MYENSRSRTCRLLAMTIVTGFIISGLCLAAEFSADFVDVKMGRTSVGKVYVKGDKVRREETQGPQKSITIYRMDKGVVWILDPAKKTYMEMPGGGEDLANLSITDPRVNETLKGLGEYKLVGTETVNGYVCDKYAFVYHEKMMGAQYQWIAKKFNVPIKTEQKGSSFSMLIEYKNIKEEPVSDSLFETPTGYTKVSFPGLGGMRGMPNIPRGPEADVEPEDEDEPE